MNQESALQDKKTIILLYNAHHIAIAAMYVCIMFNSITLVYASI